MTTQDKSRPHNQPPRDYGETDWAALDAMTEEEIEAAARSDPDAPLPRPGRRIVRSPRVRFVRLKLGIPLVAFAERYGIPRETIMAWERHEVEADAVAVSFLNAILADPEGVAAAVAKSRELAAPNPKAAE